jgi:hypothetical protein
VHTISTRAPTLKEQQVIYTLMKPDYASFGCLVVLSGGAAWTFGKIGHWIGSFFSENVSTYAQWVGWIAGVALGIPILVALIPYGRRQQKLATRDRETQLVQEIHVIDPRVIEVAMVGNIGPNLAIDIGDEKILYLQGQWLYDCDIYGAESPENDEGDELFNGLPAPHSFPCSEFTISRLPNSGEVLHIRVAGNYLPPETPVEALKPEHRFQPSELFKGSLDDLAGVMQREHATRKAR